MKRELKAEGWNYAFVPKSVFLSPELNHADVRLYCYLLWRTGRKDNSWPSVETMADDLHMSYASVKLSLRSLIKNEWIRRERTFKGSSTTWIYETQEDCRMANRLADVQLTGEPTMGQQDSRLNESHRTRSARENHSRTSEAQKQVAPTNDIKAAYEHLLGYPLNGEWAAGEGKAAKSIGDRFTVEQLEQAYQHYKSQKFWDDKRLTLCYLNKQMPEYLKKNSASAYASTTEEVQAEFIRNNPGKELPSMRAVRLAKEALK